MKTFLYKAKGALALALSMSLFSSTIFAAEPLSAEQQGVQSVPLQELTAEEVAALALPQLTVEEALKKAKKHSSSLKDLADTLEYMQDADEKIYDWVGAVSIPSYEYKRWTNDAWYTLVSNVFALDNGIKQTKLGEQVANLGIEAAVKGYFIQIVLMEDGLELAKQKAELEKIAYQQGQTKYRLGLLSTYELDKLQIAAQQAQDTVTNTEAALEQQYISFNSLIGENADKRFDFVYDVEFTPFTMDQTLDQYVNDKTKNDISIQIQELKLEQAKFTSNYRAESDSGTTADNDKLNYDKAKRDLKTAKENLEKEIRNAYLDIQQFETKYASAQADLRNAQANYRAVQVNLQAGRVTKTTVQQAKMGVTAAENALKQLVYQHDMQVFQFKNPSMLTMAQ